MSLFRTIFSSIGLITSEPTPIEEGKEYISEEISVKDSIFKDFLDRENLQTLCENEKSLPDADSEPQEEIYRTKYQRELLKEIPEIYLKDENYEGSLRFELSSKELNLHSNVEARCEFLDQCCKKVEKTLNFFLDKHSLKILKGMKKIRSIEETIKSTQESVGEARRKAGFLKSHLKDSLIRLYLLRRRQIKIKQTRQVLDALIKSYQQQYFTIQENIKLGNVSKANTDLLLLSLNMEKRDISAVVVLCQLRDRLPLLATKIKELAHTKLEQMLISFNPAIYTDISNYFEQQYDPKSSDKHPLLEVIRSGCKALLKRSSKNVLQEKCGTHSKLMDLVQALDAHKLIDCLNKIFRIHSGVMYSQHQIISFHERRQARLRQEEIKQQKSGTIRRREGIGFHHAIRVLLLDDKKELWQELQSKICSILRKAGHKICVLSIPELFELLALCSKYLQIGEECAGIAGSYLRETLNNLICLPYVQEFRYTQLKQLKMSLEGDTWKRRPYPDSYVPPELHSFLQRYSNQSREYHKSLLEGFVSSIKPRNESPKASCISLFAQIATSNPFDQECKFITTFVWCCCKRIDTRRD